MKWFFAIAVAWGAVLVAQASPLAGERTVAVLAALDTELDALKKEVELVGGALQFEGRPVWQARWRSKRLLLTKTGANPQTAGAIARWLVEECNVGAVISIGPAGALSDELEIGDVVMARKAVRSQESEVRSQNLEIVTGCNVRTANTIVTVDQFVASSAERARLRERYNADVVDMSAAAIAYVVGRVPSRGAIPCLIIREITDRADEGAPRAFAETVREKQPRTVATALCALEKATNERE